MGGSLSTRKEGRKEGKKEGKKGGKREGRTEGRKEAKEAKEAKERRKEGVSHLIGGGFIVDKVAPGVVAAIAVCNVLRVRNAVNVHVVVAAVKDPEKLVILRQNGDVRVVVSEW